MSDERSDLDRWIDELVQADTPLEMGQALQRHPELLKAEAQEGLATRLESEADPSARERLNSASIYLEAYHQQMAQAGFPEALHWRIFTAQLYEHAYAGTQDAVYLDGALDWWLGTLDSEGFRTAATGFQLDALGSTAMVFLKRFQATRNVDDISSFIALIQKKIVLRPDADEVPMLYNNLGQAFKDRMSVQPSSDDARASADAYEHAMSAAKDDDPERLRFAWGLCQARFNNYWHSLDPDDVRKGLAAAAVVSELREQTLAPFLDQVGGALMEHAAASGQPTSMDAAIEVFSVVGADARLEPDARTVYEGRLGRALLERAVGRSDPEGLRAAIQVLEGAAAARRSADAELLTIYSFLSDAFGRSLELGYDPELSARAADHHRRALELADRLGEPKLQFLVLLAGVRRSDFDESGEPADLDTALSLLAEALALCEEDPQRRATVLGQASSIRLKGHTQLGRTNDLESAIDTLEQALRFAADDHPNRPDFLDLLAVALRSRYQETGAIDDLEQSISHSIQAIAALADGDRVRRARFETNVGLALVDRSRHRDSLGDLDEAIGSFEYALETMSAFGNAAAERTNLGLALARRARLASQPDDLNRAIQHFEEALALIADRSPDRIALLHNLATALTERVEQRWDDADVERATSLVRSAIGAVTEEIPALPMYHKTLGDLLKARFARSTVAADRIAAAEAYRRGAELGLTRAYELAMANARSWILWAWERSAWEEVREAYGLLAEATTNLVQAQVFRRTKSIWLKEVQSLSAMAAYALVRLDAPLSAAEALEEGQARMLSEALMLEQIDLSSLEGTEHDGLVRDYRDAVSALARELRSGSSAGVRPAHDRVDALNDEIRAIPGLEGFLRADGGRHLATAAALSPIAYLASTSRGGLCVIVERDDGGAVAARWVDLPMLSESQLDLRLYGADDEVGYLEAYDRWLDDQDDPEAARGWFHQLDSLASWLWESVLGPMVAAGIPDEITFVSVGRTALLPLHAAYERTIESGTGSYAIDLLTLTYAPNARSVASRAERAGRLGDDPADLAFVGVVAGANEPVLPSAGVETRGAASLFAASRVFQDEHAAATSVIPALAAHQVAHFACHAQSDLGSPNESFLLLDDEERLTVGELLAVSGLELRLAFLSACETGRPGTTLPDEIIGLPSAMIAAGACGVIASSWAVTDVGGFVLATRFYDEWSAGSPPSTALRSAQRWMREAPWSSVLDYLEEKVRSGSVEASGLERVRRRAEGARPEKRPFRHPFFWGAFAYTGL